MSLSLDHLNQLLITVIILNVSKKKKKKRSQYSERKTVFPNIEHKLPVQEGELTSFLPCNLSLEDPITALQINFPPVIFILK